jgi:soluble lytic murein transglycosylase
MPSGPAISTNLNAPPASSASTNCRRTSTATACACGWTSGDSAGLRDFLQRHDGSYVAEKLRADWIRWLAKRSTWNEVDAEFPKMLAPEPDIVCLNQQARLARDDRTVLAEAEKLWLTMLEPPEACRPILDALVASQRLGTDEVWARARRQLEANRPGWTKTTLNYLPDSQMPEGKALDSATNSAMSHLVRLPANWHASRAGRELAAFAIQRLATNDPARRRRRT